MKEAILSFLRGRQTRITLLYHIKSFEWYTFLTGKLIKMQNSHNPQF